MRIERLLTKADAAKIRASAFKGARERYLSPAEAKRDNGRRMTREEFVNVAEEALDSLPEEFRSRIQNVAILVEDFPPNQSPPQPGKPRRLLLGIFHGVPATKKSIFDVPVGPAHIVLYQKNVEAVCSSEAEVRQQIRQTLIHELGHYFGMTEEQLRDV